MTIIDFIRDKYPIEDRIRSMQANPYQVVANEDGLPYDEIGPDEDGNITKLVIVNDDGRKVSVVDLITSTKEELERDPELKNAYDIYMTQVEIEDVNLSDIKRMANSYKMKRKESEEAAGVLSL